MPKHKTRKWLVIVVPGKPAAMVGVGSQGITYTPTPRTQVKVVEAAHQKEAAEAASIDIPPGSTAYVVEDELVCKFTRPAKAPLEAA